MGVGGEDTGDAGEREAGADGADEEEGFATDFIDDGDAEEGGDEVGEADVDGLRGGGDAGEAGCSRRCR